jgi:hypothetical protein
MKISSIFSSLINLIALVIMTLILSPACTISKEAPANPSATMVHIIPSTPKASPSSSVNMELSLSQAPKLGESAELTCTVNLKKPADNVTIEIDLPEGIERLSGDLNWFGDIPSGGTRNAANWEDQVDKKVELKASVKAIKTGEWVIQARAWYSLGPGFVRADAKYIFLNVTTDSAEMSEMPFNKPEVFIPGGESVPLALEVALLISRAPALNETAEITCIAKARPNPTFSGTFTDQNTPVTVQILLTEGFMLVSGDQIWVGYLPTREESQVEIKATVKAVKTGDWKIACTAKQVDVHGITVGARDLVQMKVAESPAESEYFISTQLATPQIPLRLHVKWAPSQKPPLLNQPTEVTWILESSPTSEALNYEATTKVTVEIELPPAAFTSVNGNPTWTGELPTNKESQIEINGLVTPTKTGYWFITAHITQIDLQGNIADSWNIFGIGIAEDHTDFLPAPLLPPGASPPPPPYRWGPGSQSINTQKTETELSISGSDLIVNGIAHSLISMDQCPPAGQQRADIEQPTVWAAIYIYDTLNQLLGYGVTGPVLDNTVPGKFSIPIQNPGPDFGFFVDVKPMISVCIVKRPGDPADDTSYFENKGPFLYNMVLPSSCSQKWYNSQRMHRMEIKRVLGVSITQLQMITMTVVL